jgi:hypothetical protein
MIRAVADLLTLWIPREFIGNVQTMQIRAEFIDTRRDPLSRLPHEDAERSQAAERDACTRSTAHCLISDFTHATASGPKRTGA